MKNTISILLLIFVMLSGCSKDELSNEIMQSKDSKLVYFAYEAKNNFQANKGEKITFLFDKKVDATVVEKYNNIHIISLPKEYASFLQMYKNDVPFFKGNN